MPLTSASGGDRCFSHLKECAADVNRIYVGNLESTDFVVVDGARLLIAVKNKDHHVGLLAIVNPVTMKLH